MMVFIQKNTCVDGLYGPEEGHKNDPRAGTPFLGGKAERAEAVQPRGEKAPGKP